MNLRLPAFALLMLLPAVPVAKESENALYRCRGNDGVTSFQQKPCGEDQLDAGRIPYDPMEAPPRAAPAAAVAPAPPAALPPPSPTPAESENASIEADEPVGEPTVGSPPPPAQFSGTPAVSEPPSDAVECLRPDSSTYIRSGECERSRFGGEKIEGFVIDEETGGRVWMETVTPLREVLDPARALTRLEACELAKLHIEQINAGKAEGGVYLADARKVRDRHCD
ncbi:DUF4124 domain-containing protein [Pseudomarimonas salicorniae]|uniref:DUF4124 domain-containing protein n=1 Tax=Pseudomarimonas salicorniae TaxID=2933270 RepID=A0ABT0GKE4_9GAMM|nr:DUF4124 domain-containing protein [Lysobacter sp. CAU 1642]MCK7594883.1 DUF4124 domain-containing protein [Lysobacter sp. CAU 1642]